MEIKTENNNTILKSSFLLQIFAKNGWLGGKTGLSEDLNDLKGRIKG